MPAKVFGGKDLKVEKYCFYPVAFRQSEQNAAMILSKNITMGVVSGEHGLSLKLGMVPQTEELNAGDEVVTSGLEQKYARTSYR